MGNKRTRRAPLLKAEYNKLRQTAYEMVVIRGLDQKEVAKKLNITEATISKWANSGKEGKWKELRQARQQCVSTDGDNIKKLLQVMSEQRLFIEEEILAAKKAGGREEEIRLRKEARSLSDEMAKQNKTLANLAKTDYTLGQFIDVMDSIFSHLREYDEELWNKTINFQATLVGRMTKELG